ncbi:MAG TPA: adenylate kinase, partial [Nitrososphaeraceae archaeon]|nr:adenylate kinase [Nitrososphaeraceae archaeon]
ERTKRIVVVGIPGVGKTTIVSNVKKTLDEKEIRTVVAEFGKIMLEEATKLKIQSRDEIRRLSISEQKNLQNTAAEKISQISSDVVIVDTHLFINTKEGYYPGLPFDLLNNLKPTNLILITANPEEIYHRRQNDSSRNRDMISIDSIKNDIDVSKMLILCCSVVSGAPFKILSNHENSITDCTEKMVSLILDNPKQDR